MDRSCRGYGIRMRAAFQDNRIQAVKNLCPNPSAEKSPGNWEIRRNLLVDPRAYTKYSVYWGTGGAGTTTYETSNTAPDGGPFRRMTVTTKSTLGNPYLTFGASGFFAPVTAGVTYTASVYVRTSRVGQVVRLNSAGHTDVNGSGWVNIAGGSATVTASGGWQRLSFTTTIPATVTHMRIITEIPGLLMDPGDTIDSAMAMLEQTTGANPYFDGSRRPARRTNMIPNPCGPAGTGWANNGFRFDSQWYGGGGAGTTSHVTGATDGPIVNGSMITKYVRKTWTTLPTTNLGALGFQFQGSTRIPVTPGQVFSGSMWWRHNNPIAPDRTPSTEAVRFSVEFWNVATGGTAISQVHQSFTPPAANVWHRVYNTWTVPAGASYMTITGLNLYWGLAASLSPGLMVDGTAAIVEATSSVGFYFDGDSGASYGWGGTANQSASHLYDMDLEPVWSGTANQSFSYLRAPRVDGFGVGDWQRRGFQSSLWASSGTKSVRIMALATNNDTFIDIALPAWSSTFAGKMFTVRAVRYLEAPLTGSIGNPRMRASVNTTTGQMDCPFTYSTTYTNTAGAQLVVGTFTIPANATSWAFIRLQHGGMVGSGDVWWDNVMLVEGNYSGKYLDGSMPGCVWEGTPNASISKGWPQL